LPGCAYTEKDALYMNTEGRLQMARKAVSAPGAAQDDWKILMLLAKHCGLSWAYKSLMAVRSDMSGLPAIGDVIRIEKISTQSNDKMTTTKFKLPLANFYQTCPISRASDTMADCVTAFVDKTKKLEAA
jgi:NADH dehydrogenase/NADH:ubiquinone oxidoreductase subunit G